MILDFEYSFKMTTATVHEQNDQDAHTFMLPKFIWNTDKWQTYTDQVHLNLEEISDEFKNAINRNDFDSSLNILMNAIYQAAEIMKKA